MLIQNLYYKLKPFIPAPLRLEFRRWRAEQILQRCPGFWPIHEASGRTPEAWPGWPGGKQFAFVLSHDVEGPAGLARCRQLAELEMKHGFRSVFNFIPDGDYEVPSELLAWLTRNGFEIGVLLTSRLRCVQASAFRGELLAIQRQMNAWNTVGLRADFMLDEFGWPHDLTIDYCSSSRDVDLPATGHRSAQTIFPFWTADRDPSDPCARVGVQGPRSTRGYVELPVTLPDDLDLFGVLEHSAIEVWQRKLRWLASKGGQALLVTHPHAMSMAGHSSGESVYPVQHYSDFLKFVRDEYGEACWSALPAEVAAYCRPLRSRRPLSTRSVAMVAYSHYNSDNRVRRYAETLARRGDQVRVFCLGTEDKVRSGLWERVNGVEVLRVQSRANRESGKWLPAWRLSCFFWRTMVHLGPGNFPRGCDLLHVHNIPDFLVFAGWRLKWRGTRIILDIHDIVPELYEYKFSKETWSPLAAGLRFIEKVACWFSDHVIIANHIWKETIVSRSAPLDKVTALINNVDLEMFSPKVRTRTDDRLILIYPGSLNYHQGLDIAVNAMPLLIQRFPTIELHIYGNGPVLPGLRARAADLGLGDHVKFFKHVIIDKISEVMANADLGIVPKRAEGFGDEAFSTKVMEFMSQGLPVVISRTRIDTMYFDDSVAAFFESGNASDFARAVTEVLSLPDLRHRLSEQGLRYARANAWETMKDVYLDIVDRLTTLGGSAVCGNDDLLAGDSIEAVILEESASSSTKSLPAASVSRES